MTSPWDSSKRVFIHRAFEMHTRTTQVDELHKCVQCFDRGMAQTRQEPARPGLDEKEADAGGEPTDSTGDERRKASFYQYPLLLEK